MTKDWYYAVEGTSKGPVSPDEFASLIAAGTIQNETLVWQEGMEDWLPYGRAGGSQSDEAMPPPNPLSNTEDPARPDANTFVGAFKDGLARYVDFKTRSTRSQFWWWTLSFFLLSLVATIIDASLGFGDDGPVGMLTVLVLVLPSIAVSIRRLHDIGRSGWWILIALVPLVGSLVLLVFHCLKTQEAANQWGLPPRR